MEETMEHILLECQDSIAIPRIWGLAESLWSMKHETWPTINFGTILGCAMPNFKRVPSYNEDPKQKLIPDEGKNRLLTILISESAHFIWKIRCERVITRNGIVEDYHTDQEIRNKWLVVINTRLKRDIIYTNKTKYGPKSVKESTVLKTWSGILHNEENLMDNWVRQAGGLVGIEVCRP
ncbi:hypothetical protein BJ912DRAFT_882850 [Pholiota molesta]|nr:hypothetical protein BJ912DRAFT_882850 [Pholiota molesta]